MVAPAEFSIAIESNIPVWVALPKLNISPPKAKESDNCEAGVLPYSELKKVEAHASFKTISFACRLLIDTSSTNQE